MDSQGKKEKDQETKKSDGALITTPPGPERGPESPEVLPAIRKYQNASALRLTEQEEQILSQEVKPEEVEIRPDGLIYMPQVFFRDVLNRAFGRGQWAIIREEIKKDGNKVFYLGSLYIRRCFVAEGVGEAEYHQNNPQESWASAVESAKSDCLTRCCKDLGIGKELWQPRFGEEWKKKYAVKVWVEKKDKTSGVAWRRREADAFWNEKGIVQEKSKKSVPEPRDAVVASGGASESEVQHGKPVQEKQRAQDPEKLKNEDAVIPFGFLQGKRFVDVSQQQLKNAIEWAKKNAPKKYATFIKKAQDFLADDGLNFNSEPQSGSKGKELQQQKNFDYYVKRIEEATTIPEVEKLAKDLGPDVILGEITEKQSQELSDMMDAKALKLVE